MLNHCRIFILLVVKQLILPASDFCVLSFGLYAYVCLHCPLTSNLVHILKTLYLKKGQNRAVTF